MSVKDIVQLFDVYCHFCDKNVKLLTIGFFVSHVGFKLECGHQFEVPISGVNIRREP